MPDIIIGCAGGGSNLGGLISPFMGEKLRGERNYRFIAVEPASCPSLTRGRFAYDFCDTGKVCPLAKMYTLGSGFIPSPSHAGGLRYHGMSPVLSQALPRRLHGGPRRRARPRSSRPPTYFARVEGILPAPESSHAIRVAIDEAVKCKETGEAKNIVFGLTGTGYFDMTAYQKSQRRHHGRLRPHRRRPRSRLRRPAQHMLLKGRQYSETRMRQKSAPAPPPSRARNVPTTDL